MKRITGVSKRDWKFAVNDALYGSGCNRHSPAVKWSIRDGFFCESKLTDNPDSVTVWVANFGADDGEPYCLPSYADVHEMIEEFIAD